MIHQIQTAITVRGESTMMGTKLIVLLVEGHTHGGENLALFVVVKRDTQRLESGTHPCDHAM
jgi:hypothetical protein